MEGGLNDTVFGVPAGDWTWRYVFAYAVLVVQVGWATLMAVGALGKIGEFGLLPYVCHFTNWSWTAQLLFYYATAAAPFVLTGIIDERSSVGALTRALLVLAFFPLNGVIFTVMFVVSVLLGTGSPFLTDIFTKYPPEIVFLGNDLMHFWPIVVLLLYFIVYRKLIAYSLNRVLVAYDIIESPWRFTLFIGYQAYGGAGIALAIYSLIFDPREVYESDQPIVVGVVAVAVSLTIFNLTPLLIVLALGVASPVRYSRAWLLRNDVDPRLSPADDSRRVKSY